MPVGHALVFRNRDRTDIRLENLELITRRELGSSGAGRMLVALANVYPRTMTRAELSEASQVSAAGGSFNTYLSKLRTLELVEGKTELRASDELFSLTGAHR